MIGLQNTGDHRRQEHDTAMKKETVYRLFSHIPILETPRLILRGMKVSDAADMYAYASRPAVSEYLLWTPHENIGHTRDYLTYVSQRYRTGDFFDWAIVDRESGHMIGTCGFTSFRFESDVGEIGYVLNPDWQGRGLGTEAVRRIMRFGCEELQLHRIEARFMEGNVRSLRMMERVGMRFEGYARESMKVKGVFRTIGTCAILASEAERALRA